MRCNGFVSDNNPLPLHGGRNNNLIHIFVFVKLFIGLVFSATSAIGGATMNLDTASYAAPLGKLQAMWFSPTLSGPFFGRFYLFPLSASESLASFLIAIWVFLLVGLVIAFAISFFFCGYTLIYLLMRRSVDATELDDVYVEEFETPLPEPQQETAPEGESQPQPEQEQEAKPPESESQQPQQEAKPSEEPPSTPPASTSPPDEDKKTDES